MTLIGITGAPWRSGPTPSASGPSSSVSRARPRGLHQRLADLQQLGLRRRGARPPAADPAAARRLGRHLRPAAGADRSAHPSSSPSPRGLLICSPAPRPPPPRVIEPLRPPAHLVVERRRHHRRRRRARSPASAASSTGASRSGVVGRARRRHARRPARGARRSSSSAGGQMLAGVYDQPDLVTVAANGADGLVRRRARGPRRGRHRQPRLHGRVGRARRRRRDLRTRPHRSAREVERRGAPKPIRGAATPSSGPPRRRPRPPTSPRSPS